MMPSKNLRLCCSALLWYHLHVFPQNQRALLPAEGYRKRGKDPRGGERRRARVRVKEERLEKYGGRVHPNNEDSESIRKGRIRDNDFRGCFW